MFHQGVHKITKNKLKYKTIPYTIHKIIQKHRSTRGYQQVSFLMLIQRDDLLGKKSRPAEMAPISSAEESSSLEAAIKKALYETWSTSPQLKEVHAGRHQQAR